MIRVELSKGHNLGFKADKFRIDEAGRLVLLSGQGEDMLPVAVFATWTGVWESESREGQR